MLVMLLGERKDLRLGCSTLGLGTLCGRWWCDVLICRGRHTDSSISVNMFQCHSVCVCRSENNLSLTVFFHLRVLGVQLGSSGLATTALPAELTPVFYLLLWCQ